MCFSNVLLNSRIMKNKIWVLIVQKLPFQEEAGKLEVFQRRIMDCKFNSILFQLFHPAPVLGRLYIV